LANLALFHRYARRNNRHLNPEKEGIDIAKCARRDLCFSWDENNPRDVQANGISSIPFAKYNPSTGANSKTLKTLLSTGIG
jgi:hypothetical protein